MSEPTIAEAKALAYKHRKVGIIIIAFTGDAVSTASYGMRRVDCDTMGRIAERIIDMLGEEQGALL